MLFNQMKKVKILFLLYDILCPLPPCRNCHTVSLPFATAPYAATGAPYAKSDHLERLFEAATSTYYALVAVRSFEFRFGKQRFVKTAAKLSAVGVMG